MLAGFARLATRRPIWVVAAWVVLTSLAAALAMTGLGGQPLFSKLENGEPSAPGSQSHQVREILAASPTGAATTLVVDGVDLTDTATVAAVGSALTTLRPQLLALDGVSEVTDPFQHPLGPLQPEVAGLVAPDGTAFLLRVTLSPDLGESQERAAALAVEHALGDVGTTLVSDDLATDTAITSTAILLRAVNAQMERDLVRGELVALPISLLVMIVVFAGALAAGMPVVGALASIAGGLGTVWALSFVMDLDSVVINVVSVLGLGLSIDYGLLMVSRFREELRHLVAAEQEAITQGIAVGRRRRGGRRRDALVRRAVEQTVATAGRTVVFSALTIAMCVCGLIAMPPALLRGIGVSAAAVVLVALLSAVSLVPALLTLSGRRFLRPSVLARVPLLRHVVGRLGEVAPERGVFSALTTWVQRYPWPVLVGCVALLAVAMTPLANLHLRNSGVEILPAQSAERLTYQDLTARFPAASSPDIWIVPQPGPGSDAPAVIDPGALTTLAADLTAVDGVAEVDSPRPIGDAEGHLLVGVHLDEMAPGSPEAVEVVRQIRTLDTAVPLLVGGQAAGQLDFSASLLRGLPLAGALVLVATFVLLFLMTGSVLVPFKALLTNVVSIAASLGITTCVFQGGHGQGLLGFESAGGLESYIVAVIVAFGFGLAMDYEVFLIARIKELYDAGVPNNEAVVRGLQRSGRIITSAALVIIVVFAGFASGELLLIKEVGFGLAVAVALDATLVRMLLVPATMTVLGDANWWAPRWLRPIARRFAVAH